MHSLMFIPKKLVGSLYVSLLCAVFVVFMPTTECKAQYDDDYISYNDFYQNLSAYGQWIDDPEYGYVWSPEVDADFRPYYTNGYWVTTEYGNTWVSDYNWGWACFHYGCWTYDQYYGWLWIPGNHWGPAWVTWRYGDGFYGWSPLGPDYRSGTPITGYYCPDDWWVFIPPQYLYSGNYYRYWFGPRGNRHLIENTTVINNTFIYNNVTFITGPSTAQVKQVTGNTVQVLKVRNSKNFNTRVHGEVVRMYKPSEIRPVARYSGSQPAPYDAIAAPRRIGKPQSILENPNSTPPFRAVVAERNSARNTPTPGTNINKTAEPTRATRRVDNNPYEWDVSRPVKQEYTPPARKREDTRSEKKPATPKAPPTRQATQPSKPVAPTPAKPKMEGGRNSK